MKTRSSIGRTRADVVFDGVNFALSLVLLAAFLYPLYYVLIASISDPYAVWNGKVIFFPKGLTLAGYRQILTYRDILTGYRNSIAYTAASILLSLTLTISAAYPLAQRNFLLRGAFSKFLLFTMFFSGGLIPTYLMIKTLRILNTPLAVILPGAASVTNIIITRTFFQTTLPAELREAAFLDGCSHLRYLFSITLPLSKAILAVMALYYGVGQWNSFFNAMIYLTNRDLYTLQLVLREILLTSSVTLETGGDPQALAEQQRIGEIIKYGVIVVAAVPALAAYPFVQRFFIKGVMIGSLKG